jgi:hypothetical protein
MGPLKMLDPEKVMTISVAGHMEAKLPDHGCSPASPVARYDWGCRRPGERLRTLTNREDRLERKRAATLTRHAAELAQLDAEKEQLEADRAEVEAHNLRFKQRSTVRAVMYRIFSRAWRNSSPEQAKRVEANIARAVADGKVVLRHDGLVCAFGDGNPVLIPITPRAVPDDEPPMPMLTQDAGEALLALIQYKGDG